MDSSESPVDGEQKGTAYNGHLGCVCHHPLFVFNQFGDCEGAKLRPGNVHCAHDWGQVPKPIMSRYERTGVRRYPSRCSLCPLGSLCVPGIAEGPLRHQAPQQTGAGAGDSAPAEVPCGETAEKARRLSVSGGELGPAKEGRGQGGMVPGRTVPSGGRHRHRHDGQARGCGALLQWAGHGAAVDQRGQIRPQLDPARLPPVCSQPCAAVATRPRLQPGALREKTCLD